MADIVNLNQYRKKKALAEKKAQAARNRVKEGRSKPARSAERLASERNAKALDDAKIEPREDD
jgi:Domain of unknown function (DUF4169)